MGRRGTSPNFWNDEKNDPIGLIFVKMRAQKRSKNNEKLQKKGTNKIENQRENWYKMLQNGEMTNFSETFDQL